MARALIVGCGCRGRAVGERLRAQGLAVRGTSRSAPGLGKIEAAGFEAAEADPLLPGTVLDLVGDVALVIWLMGSVGAGAGRDGGGSAGVNGERLESLLSRLVDTPVRGFAYEAAGEAEGGELARGRGVVEKAASTWSIPAAFIEEAPAGDWDAWADRAAAAALRLLG